MSIRSKTPIKLSGIFRSVGLFSFASALLALVFLSVTPTQSGKALREETAKVSDFIDPIMKNLGIPFEIRMIRDSKLSIAGHELALFLAPHTMKESSSAASAFVRDLHGEGVITAVSQKLLRTCTIVVSGEGSHGNHPVALLLKHVKDENSAWRLALLHESAHCVRNVAAYRIDALKAGVWHESNPFYNHLFASYLSEAYSDAYSLFAFYHLDKNADINDIALSVIEFRKSSNSGPSYKTEGAVSEALGIINKSKANGLNIDVNDFDNFALQSALHGSQSWFETMKIDSSAISSDFIKNLISSASAEKKIKGHRDV